MIVPLVAEGWHLPAMALATAVMVTERTERIMRPHWRVPTVCRFFENQLLEARGRLAHA